MINQTKLCASAFSRNICNINGGDLMENVAFLRLWTRNIVSGDVANRIAPYHIFIYMHIFRSHNANAHFIYSLCRIVFAETCLVICRLQHMKRTSWSSTSVKCHSHQSFQFSVCVCVSLSQYMVFIQCEYIYFVYWLTLIHFIHPSAICKSRFYIA